MNLHEDILLNRCTNMGSQSSSTYTQKEKERGCHIEETKKHSTNERIQCKTQEKELKKMETANLSDAEFKTLVIRVLRELSEYSNTTGKEMKAALSEIKKNLQGTNSGKNEAQNQINDLEHKEGKSIQSEQ